MTGPLALSPLETLYRMSPLAFLQALLYSAITGEISSFKQHLTIPLVDIIPLRALEYLPIYLPAHSLAFALLGNGLIAFLLNISSFSTNKTTSALTMTVCGNVKQCLTIVLGIVIFGVQVGVWNGLGMLITLAGAAWYSVIELGTRRKR